MDYSPWLLNKISSSKYLLTSHKVLKIYVCGPTVYNDIHIGNLRPVMVFDFLIRLLRYLKIKHKYIHNITDIDDKIIVKALKGCKPESYISTLYKERYFDILKQMNVIPAHQFPLVTEHINEIIDVIHDLTNKQFAYANDGTIWFDISKLEDKYGSLSNQNTDELLTTDKFDLNFALWKKTTLGQTWESPWGLGRPGWHIECYSFIKKYLDNHAHIHGGGIDLKFPHHENENILCQACADKPICDLWMHIGHITMNHEKLSKSKHGGILLVKDMLEKYCSNTLRFIFLQNSYDKPCDISDERLETLHKEWNSFYQAINTAKTTLLINNKTYKTSSGVHLDTQFIEYLCNNLNLPEALKHLQSLKKDLLGYIKQNNLAKINKYLNLLTKHLQFLGFTIKDIHTEENIALINSWTECLQNKNYAEADKLRTNLQTLLLII